MKTAKLSTLDLDVFACHLLGVDYFDIDANNETISDKLEQQFGCDFEQFKILMEMLLPMVDVGIAGNHKGFYDSENDRWFLKTDVY